MAQATGRNILVALDTSEASLNALQWAAKEIVRPDDFVHVVHVAKVMSPQCVIQHSQPGTSYTVPGSGGSDEETLQTVRHMLKSRYLSVLDAAKITHTLHLYLDTDNAPASAIGDTIIRVADETKADLVVMSSHNRTAWEELFVGSVADYCFRNCKRPLAVIRNYPASHGAAYSSCTPSFPASGQRILPELKQAGLHLSLETAA